MSPMRRVNGSLQKKNNFRKQQYNKNTLSMAPHPVRKQLDDCQRWPRRRGREPDTLHVCQVVTRRLYEVDLIALLITRLHRLANMSFSSGVFPSAPKQGRVIPLLKKPGLDLSWASENAELENAGPSHRP